jgi:curli biogenesis system outer membrane secretion channel CsgG
MLALMLAIGMTAQAATGTAKPAAPADAQTAQTPSSAPTKGADTDAVALLKVKRIYVDSFGEDIISKEIQSMVVSSLVATKRFKVTENRERADAILKGVALEKTSQELHAYGEATAVGGASGGHSSSISGSGGTFSGSSSGGFAAHNEAMNDSSVNTETVNEARVAIRLVNPDGDVIWTSTQESKGAKYKGSSADAADKCVKQLLRDVEKIEGNATTPVVPGAATPDTQHR